MIPLCFGTTLFLSGPGLFLRIALAFGTAFGLAVFLVPRVIRFVEKHHAGQPVRSDGPQTHLVKAGRPSMGGIGILIGGLIGAGLFAYPTPEGVAAVAVTLLMAVTGLADDLLKFMKRNPKGLAARYKLLAQLLAGIGMAWYLQASGGRSSDLFIPFYGSLPVGPVVWPLFASFVIAATSNAVNLVDGQDGLAAGVFSITGGALALLVLAVSFPVLATSLALPIAPAGSELTVFLSGMIGATLGFFWWNAPPALIFMGDVGSLAIGGAIAATALATRLEFWLPLVGGLFVIEDLSVIAQVASFKLRGVRVLRMAPIHHHFEQAGWPETRVTARFWIVSALFAGLTLAALAAHAAWRTG